MNQNINQILKFTSEVNTFKVINNVTDEKHDKPIFFYLKTTFVKTKFKSFGFNTVYFVIKTILLIIFIL